MSARLHVLHLALVTLETVTPLSLATGASDPLFDTLLARDANGLPMMPGTSLAGVLRHLYTAEHGRDAANALFGLDAKEIADRARRRDAAPENHEDASYEASVLQVSSALLHDARDRPVTATPADEETLKKDEILAHALSVQPIERDHVRLTDRGVADTGERGKFTRAALACGCRFSFELALWSEARPDPRWETLRGLFAHAGFRLGGGTRRGFGEVAVVRWLERAFDLRDKADAAAYRAFQGATGARDLAGFKAPDAPPIRTAPLRATLMLRPVDFFRFGAGAAPLGKGQGKPPTLLPLSERQVFWRADGQGGECGEFSKRRAVIPASAIKGAIRHRVAFHYNRCAKKFLDEVDDRGLARIRTENDSVNCLFGPELDAKKTVKPWAGRVMFSDLLLPELDTQKRIGWMTHNSIDRFSGGTRHGALYTEELLFDCPFQLTITILDPHDAELAPRTIRQAFRAALDDLAQGRLALGAGGSKGHGYFTAAAGIAWCDGGAWIDGGSA